MAKTHGCFCTSSSGLTWLTPSGHFPFGADRIAFSEEMAKFYESGDYFGLAKDTSAALEDTLHNEMYFDQFLAWFGTSLMSGAFVNVIDAIDNPKTPTPGDSSSLTRIPEVPVDSDTVVVDSTDKPEDPKGGEDDKGDDKIIASAALASSSIRFVEMDGGVMFSADYPVKWAVYDLTGHRVLSASGKTFLWNTRGMNGVYVVKALCRGSSFTHKVLVR